MYDYVCIPYPILPHPIPSHAAPIPTHPNATSRGGSADGSKWPRSLRMFGSDSSTWRIRFNFTWAEKTCRNLFHMIKQSNRFLWYWLNYYWLMWFETPLRFLHLIGQMITLNSMNLHFHENFTQSMGLSWAFFMLTLQGFCVQIDVQAPCKLCFQTEQRFPAIMQIYQHMFLRLQ